MFGAGFFGPGYYGDGFFDATGSASSSYSAGGYFGRSYFGGGHFGPGYYGSGDVVSGGGNPGNFFDGEYFGGSFFGEVAVPDSGVTGSGHYPKGKILNATQGNYYPFGKKKLRDKKKEAEEELARVEAEILALQKKESDSWSHFNHIHVLKQDALELLEKVQDLDSELELIKLLNPPELDDRGDDAEIDEIRKVYEAYIRSTH